SSRCSAGMLLNRIPRVSRTQGPTWSTTQADPPTVQRAGELPERYAGTPPSAETWRIPPNRSPCPLTCECLERGIAHRRTARLATPQVGLPDASIHPGLPVKVGKVSLARTVSLNSVRSPS